MMEKTEVAIIGAGPAGSIAAALLRRKGRKVTILEASRFPRFSIGESLLPQCMSFLHEAGMGKAVDKAGYQHKNGATFTRRGQKTAFDFRHKFSSGPGTTFQVQRASFDNLLANEAIALGADVRFEHRITRMCYLADGKPCLDYLTPNGTTQRLGAEFVLDASGFGRVLPRLLDLELPSSFPTRKSLFTHIEDNITHPEYDRDKILISIHPQRDDVWYWLIPFSDGRSSIGVVAEETFFDSSKDNLDQLKAKVAECPELHAFLVDAHFDSPANAISGYSCRVKSLWGPGFALLGNSAEFLDPVFSSGVTIAMKSASLATQLLNQQLNGDAVEWQRDYADALQKGIDTFRAYVEAWYSGDFQTVIFAQQQQEKIREMICSILAGYAWDEQNPFVRSPQRLDALVELCTST